MYNRKSKGVGYKLNETEVLRKLCDRIIELSCKNDTKIISIVGGAASGKTTLTHKLIQCLGDADFIGTDDYVVGDREYRRNNLEGKDPTAKYDVARLNKDIEAIINIRENDTYLVPTYDESTGLAVDSPNYKHKIGKVKYLIVEGDFDFVQNPDLKIYYDVPDEIRLENRIHRDLKKRSETDFEKIKENFEIRQKLQHEPYTIKARDSANLVVSVTPVIQNDILAYEYSLGYFKYRI